MSIADIVVIAVVLFCGMMAFSMGFVRVVLALLGWVGAALATLYGFRYVRPIAHDLISIGFLADAAAGIVIFLASLFVLTLISHAIGRQVRDSRLSAFDRSVGLLLGLGIGGVLVSLAYMGVLWIEKPELVKDAKTLPLLVWGATRLNGAFPAEWRGKVSTVDPGPNSIREGFEKLVEPETKSPTTPSKEGYTDQQRREMDRLIKGQN